MTPRALSERFWSSVRLDGSAPAHCPELGACWEWRASTTGKGYGQFLVGSKRDGSRRLRKAHRVAWELQCGAIPDGLLVCHRCDNPRCVRAIHLFLGTVADNNRDMFAKGRGRPRRFNDLDRARAAERRRSAVNQGKL